MRVKARSNLMPAPHTTVSWQACRAALRVPVVCFPALKGVDAVPLRLATLLTVVLLPVPSWSGETKVTPKQRGMRDGVDNAQNRAPQDQAYLKSLQNQMCRAPKLAPDCTQQELRNL